jgi:hypothetical protein
MTAPIFCAPRALTFFSHSNRGFVCAAGSQLAGSVPYIRVMGHVDTCLGTLRRLIADGDINGIPLAEAAIEEYWAATPAKARKSGLLYIQQILHDRRATLNPQSRDFATTVDAYIEKKLVT